VSKSPAVDVALRKMSFLNNLLGGARSATDKAMRQPQIAAFKNQVEDLMQHVGDELGVLDELRYEWRRLQSFNNWPHDLPRPSELAKAGFFFSPIPQEPDRCAHFCNDKFFSSWDPDDDPLTVLEANCPNCPFLTGQAGNVPLPSAYERTGGRSGGEEESDGQEKVEKPALLGSYLSGAVQKAAGPDATVGASSLKGLAGEPQISASSEAEGVGDLPTAGASSGGLQVKSKSLRGKGKKAGGRKAAGGGLGGGSDDGAGPKVWEFPSAVGAGGGSEHGSEHGGYTPRAGGMSKEDLVALQAAVGTAVGGMQGMWEKQLNRLDGRLASFKDRIAHLSSRAAALSDPKWLDGKREALKGLLAEEAAEKETLAEVKQAVAAARKELDECRQQLEKVAKAEEVMEETDRRVREATEELQDLEDSKVVIEMEMSSCQSCARLVGAIAKRSSPCLECHPAEYS